MIGRDVRLTSMLLLGVVGLVLALCCANVANLVLARGTARARELAVRAALGAGRRRIVAQLLTESLVLAALGGLLGSVVGALLLDAARSFIPSNLLPPAVVLGFGSRIAGFSIVTALIVGVLFGLVSAWRVTGFSLTSALTAGSRTSTGHGSWLRSAIVAGEVAVAVVVLCGAGLLLRTLLVLDGFESGYGAQRERLLSVLVSVPALTPGSRYPTSESLVQFYDAIDREVRRFRRSAAQAGPPHCPWRDRKSAERRSISSGLHRRQTACARRPISRSSARVTSTRSDCRWSRVERSPTMTEAVLLRCAS